MHCTAGEEVRCIVVEEDTVVGTVANEVGVHSVVSTSSLEEGISVLDAAFLYPVSPAGSKSRQFRYAEVEGKTFWRRASGEDERKKKRS